MPATVIVAPVLTLAAGVALSAMLWGMLTSDVETSPQLGGAPASAVAISSRAEH